MTRIDADLFGFIRDDLRPYTSSAFYGRVFADARDPAREV